MKKIDFHMHTVSTVSDYDFEFSLSKLKEYVTKAALDSIAITNHNSFDLQQYRDISDALDIAVFPGIEVDVDACHILVISDQRNLTKFVSAAEKVSNLITTDTEHITVDEFKNIFESPNDYIVIPHYQKKPEIRDSTLESIKDWVTCGEVNSVKKFVRCFKDESLLVPVIFSDCRISDEMTSVPTRQTYVDCGDVTFSGIKSCLSERNKVALSLDNGNHLYQALENGLMISTGLNVLLGARSSGKTHTLNKLNIEQKRVKYIQQFSLVQKDEKEFEKIFNSELKIRQSTHAEKYLAGLKHVIDSVLDIDIEQHEYAIGKYLETLLSSAQEADRQDAFSKAKLFSESNFSLGDDKTLIDLIKSTRQLIENIDFRDVIDKHLELSVLKLLACELIELLWDRAEEREHKKIVNQLVETIRGKLGVKSSAVQVSNIDLYSLFLEKRKIERFDMLVKHIYQCGVLLQEDVQGYTIKVEKEPFKNATDLKAVTKTNAAFSNAMKSYANPYEFLMKLLEVDGLDKSDLHKHFVKVKYTIVNKEGFEISGGERSEFRLLQEISDAHHHDILLIDEPESSFDNLFLKGNVNTLIKDIANTMPVVVVTHNNTVGATIGANYYLYAACEKIDQQSVHKIYSGYPTDKYLVCDDGSKKENLLVMLDSLEAGKDAYDARRARYEAIVN